jgi:hypothetical protein
MAKQNKSTSRKAAPKADRGGASKPGDKLRIQGHGADRANAADERVAAAAGAGFEARDADERAGAEGGRDNEREPSAVRDVRKQGR